MLDNPALQTLSEIVGEDHLLTGAYDLDRYSADALTPFRAYGAEEKLESTADLVIRPGSTEEVSQVVKVAAATGTPIIPYSGGTGVMGGTVPLRCGIILDTGRLNRVIEVSPADLTTHLEAGVVLQDLGDCLSEYGLMPGHDPYSVPIATVAGTISTNGVGYRAAAHGPMGSQVVSLEVVLPDGRVLTTRQVPKYSSGPNLNQLFIGSEGVFGIITKATIRVFRKPESQTFATVSFNSFDQGFEAAAEVLALGIRPTLLDLTQESDGPPSDENSSTVLLHLCFEGFREGVAAHEQRAKEVCAQMGGRVINPEPTLEYWRDRHDSGVHYKQDALGKPRQVKWNRHSARSFDYLHLALPISKVLDYKHRCDQIMAGSGVRTVEYAIWSRPEFFSMLIVADPAAVLDADSGFDTDFRANLARVVDEVLTLAQDMGGIMEYCHGVGVKLNHLLAREMGVGHDVVRRLKEIMDPANIMNPGKLGL